MERRESPRKSRTKDLDTERTDGQKQTDRGELLSDEDGVEKKSAQVGPKVLQDDDVDDHDNENEKGGSDGDADGDINDVLSDEGNGNAGSLNQAGVGSGVRKSNVQLNKFSSDV